MKIENDKYYTPIELANYCWDKTIEVIGLNNITHMVEPSCGNGAFFHHPKYKPDVGYDIVPEFDKAQREDFLKLFLPYQVGRLCIGNPPYGRCLNLAQKFYKKAVEIGDYIAFILPISQLNNTRSMYEFDLIYSEDLGERVYTDRTLHCCFNVYVRPKSGMLNKKPTATLKDISIYRQDSKGYPEREYDIRMCYWGNGSAGKILTEGEHYSAEYKIKVNRPDLKEEIIDCLTNFDWQSYLHCIAMRKIQQFHIVDVLREEVKGIE